MNSSKRLIKIAVTSAIAATLSITAASALYAGETTATNLNLRATPGGAAIGSLPYGTKLAVISNSNEWYQVAVNGQTAYVSGAYVSWIPDTEFALGTGVIQCSTTVNFRSLPNTECEVLGSLANGTKVELIGVAQGWYKACVNGQKGFISADYVSVTGGAVVDKSTAVGSTTVSTSSGTRSGDSGLRRTVPRHPVCIRRQLPGRL